MNDEHTMSELTPEQRESADRCDDLTTIILNGTQGMAVGEVVGACFNVLDAASNYLPQDLRQMLAEKMRMVADAIAAKQDAADALRAAEPAEPGPALH